MGKNSASVGTNFDSNCQLHLKHLKLKGVNQRPIILETAVDRLFFLEEVHECRG